MPLNHLAKGKKTKKDAKKVKTYERRIDAVITFVDCGDETMTNEQIAEVLKGLLKCDDIQVKSVKTFEHEC